jgi:hypothetical protein
MSSNYGQNIHECAKVVIANKTRELKNQKHIGQWSSTLETYIYPTLGTYHWHHYQSRYC